MVEGYCYTNLDDYKQEKWPKRFVSVPLEGQRVRSTSSERYLYVASVTHEMQRCNPAGVFRGAWTPKPLIAVELGKFH